MNRFPYKINIVEENYARVFEILWNNGDIILMSPSKDCVYSCIGGPVDIKRMCCTTDPRSWVTHRYSDEQKHTFFNIAIHRTQWASAIARSAHKAQAHIHTLPGKNPDKTMYHEEILLLVFEVE